jgi:TonB family protein
MLMLRFSNRLSARHANGAIWSGRTHARVMAGFALLMIAAAPAAAAGNKPSPETRRAKPAAQRPAERATPPQTVRSLVGSLDTPAGQRDPFAPSDDEERPPVGKDNMFSEPQIRYCLAQLTRINAVRPLLDRYQSEHVKYFNAQVADLNSRCSSYRYVGPALGNARVWLATSRPRIEQDARAAYTECFAGEQVIVRGLDQGKPAAPAPPAAGTPAQVPPSAVTAQDARKPAPTPKAEAPAPPAPIEPSTAAAPAPVPASAATVEDAKPTTKAEVPAAPESPRVQEGRVSTVQRPAREERPAAPVHEPAPSAAPQAAAAEPAAATPPVETPAAHPAAAAEPTPVETRPAQPAASAKPPAVASPDTVQPPPAASAAGAAPPAATAAASDQATPASAAAQESSPAAASAAQPPAVQTAALPPATVPAPAPPQGRAEPATGIDAALERLTQDIQRDSSQVLDQPPGASDKGADLTTQIELRYAAGGYIKSIVVGESSGSAMLDRQALELARALRYPEVPEALRSREFSVRFPIVFRARR